MSRPEYNVREEYVGTNNRTQYSFEFQITDLSQILIIQTDDQFEEVFKVRGNDVTFLSSVTFNPLGGGGYVNLLANLPFDYHLFIILADDFPTQPDSYKNKNDFTLRRFEASLDKLAGEIQSLAYKAFRSIRLSDTHLDNQIDTMLPRLIAGELYVLNDNETAFDAVNLEDLVNTLIDLAITNANIPAQIANQLAALDIPGLVADEVAAQISATGGLPPGGLAGDFIEKITTTPGDADWKSGTFTGLSRFGLWSSTGLFDTISKILNITFGPPLISLSAAGSGTVREKGASVSSTLLTANVTKQTDPIANAKFYKSPSTLLSTVTTNPPVPAGGSPTFNYATPFTDTVSFYATATDDGTHNGGSGQTTTSNTVTFTFVYPYYYGLGAANLTAAQVAALTKDIIVSTVSKQINATAAGGEVPYFAYPASYGLITSVKDVNNFEVFPSFKAVRVQNITGLDGNAVSYNIYEGNNVLSAGAVQLTFIR